MTRNQACHQVSSDGSIAAENRPYPTVVKATLNPGWQASDAGVRGSNHLNYARRRRSPSPSVIKSPAVNQPTKLAPNQQQQQRGHVSARSSYHAGCTALPCVQPPSQSRIPIYQRNRAIRLTYI